MQINAQKTNDLKHVNVTVYSLFKKELTPNTKMIYIASKLNL